MTARALSRITGYDIRPAPSSEYRKTAYAAYLGPDQLFHADGWTPSEALKKLHAKIYKAHCQEAMERGDWRCQWCAAAGVPLECDHIKPRSKGRDDRVENLRGLCARCHRGRHG